MIPAASAPRPVIAGPASGRRLSPFALRTATGRAVHLREYRQRHNLVLFFHHGMACAACRTFLQALDSQAPAYRQVEAVVSDVVLLSDATDKTAGQHGLSVPALIIADRFGDIWAAWEGEARHALPDTTTIAEWLAFIDIQCPECTTIEW
jgi:peroxiredoxin